MERDFKGVWIPKEIWLNDELTLLEKAILIEIDSLDNENHCTAGNDYLAKFCQCSERKVSEAISKLSSLGFIEILKFDGRCRTIKSLMKNRALISMQSSKICEAGSQNLLSNNIDNNIDNKDKLNNKLFSTPNFYNEEKPKSKKKNQYVTCKEYIMQYTNNIVLQDALDRFLRLLLEKKNNDSNFKFWTNQWPSIVNELDNIASNTDEAVKIVNRSIQNQWNKFYPLSNKSTVKSHPAEKNVVCNKKSDEELDLADEVY